jgi:hypothetical protein
MSKIDTAREWLRLVASEHNIQDNEVHHIYRPDDPLKPIRPYVIFSFERSNQENRRAYSETTASGSYDADICLTMPFVRSLVVECWAEWGMDYLEALVASVEHPAAQDILTHGRDGDGNAEANADDASRLVVIDAGDIENPTTWDETKIDHRYTVAFRVRGHTAFEQTRTNHRLETYTMTGELIPDEGDPIEITITNA